MTARHDPPPHLLALLEDLGKALFPVLGRHAKLTTQGEVAEVFGVMLGDYFGTMFCTCHGKKHLEVFHQYFAEHYERAAHRKDLH